MYTRVWRTMIKFYSSNDDYMVSREGAKSIISVSIVEGIDVKAIPSVSREWLN